jgi:hypothetical protein
MNCPKHDTSSKKIVGIFVIYTCPRCKWSHQSILPFNAKETIRRIAYVIWQNKERSGEPSSPDQNWKEAEEEYLRTCI